MIIIIIIIIMNCGAHMHLGYRVCTNGMDLEDEIIWSSHNYTHSYKKLGRSYCFASMVWLICLWGYNIWIFFAVLVIHMLCIYLFNLVQICVCAYNACIWLFDLDFVVTFGLHHILSIHSFIFTSVLEYLSMYFMYVCIVCCLCLYNVKLYVIFLFILINHAYGKTSCVFGKLIPNHMITIN